MADTIEIIQGTATTVEVAGPTGPQGPAGAAGATGAQGPQGVPGTGLEVLTTQGDLLYQGASTGQRLPIGTTGQVLKVSGGIPAWGAESGAVSSVAGRTGAVTLAVADVADAVATSDARLSDARTPTAHKASHATGGTDALAPSDIGAQSIFARSEADVPVSGPLQLSAARAAIVSVTNNRPEARDVYLPMTSIQNGDIIVVVGATLVNPINIKVPAAGGAAIVDPNGGAVTISVTGQQYRFIVDAVGNFVPWTRVSVDTHTHAASDITSGTLVHERGGLEADVSAYNGLVKIASGSTSAVTVTTAGEALLDDADAAAQRTTLGAAASGSITTSGLTQATARILGRTTASTGSVEEIQIGSGLSLSAGELSATGSGVTAVGPSTADVLSVSGSDLVADDPNADRIVFWDDSEGKLRYLEAGSGLSISGTTLTATASGGISAVDATTADVLSVSGSNLVADDGGTIDSADPFIKWDDTAGKLVYANPLSRPTGAFYVGLAPTTTALGSNAINIQATRSIGANHVAAGLNSVVVGESRAAVESGVAIGFRAQSTGFYGVAIGQTSTATEDAVAIAINANASAIRSVALGRGAAANLRSMFGTLPFNAIYWGGQTTNATPLILNLDATATNRFTIAASTALAVDILLVARRSDTQDKWLVARRFLGIRRDGSNNTSLIGSVQTLGVDQSAGSPTWTFALTADDTNEALQLEVTGAASETVQWRATAIYRVA
jgi:hypothetical protein